MVRFIVSVHICATNVLDALWRCSMQHSPFLLDIYCANIGYLLFHYKKQGGGGARVYFLFLEKWHFSTCFGSMRSIINVKTLTQRVRTISVWKENTQLRRVTGAANYTHHLLILAGLGLECNILCDCHYFSLLFDSKSHTAWSTPLKRFTLGWMKPTL